MVHLAQQSRHLSGRYVLQPSDMRGKKVMAYGHASNKILCAQATQEMDPASSWV